tara:strand:+ start:211 stop:750 length:540 start_codon:yes stop_codon:yes gene_type:complete
MSAYFMDINIPPPPPSPIVKKIPNVKEIWSGKKWYSSMRKDYQRAVCVSWEDKHDTIEPVSNLIDFVNKEVCEKMIPILYNWKVSVENNLCRSRLCAFCSSIRKMDNFLCVECEESTKWLNAIINNEQVKNENIYITGKYFKDQIVSPDPSIIKIPVKLLKRKHSDVEELNSLLMDIHF